MKKDRQLRKFKHQIYQLSNGENMPPYFATQKHYDDMIHIGHLKQAKGIKVWLDIFEQGRKLMLTRDVVCEIYREYRDIRHDREMEYSKTPLTERRDNRKEKVINSRNDTWGQIAYRYPKKKRSLRQWRNFYNHFPHLAERDNFNGKTSERMK